MLSIIVAMTEEGVIGRKNQLPWHLSEDLIRFKQITTGHPIIMGRKTYDSIGKPLPNRTNIVVTSDTARTWEGVIAVTSFEKALETAQKAPGSEEIFVIGGARMFEAALPLANKLHLTLIHEKVTGDVKFPLVDFRKTFRVLAETRHQGEKAEKLKFSFITAVRNGHH